MIIGQINLFSLISYIAGKLENKLTEPEPLAEFSWYIQESQFLVCHEISQKYINGNVHHYKFYNNKKQLLIGVFPENFIKIPPREPPQKLFKDGKFRIFPNYNSVSSNGFLLSFSGYLNESFRSIS